LSVLFIRKFSPYVLLNQDFCTFDGHFVDESPGLINFLEYFHFFQWQRAIDNKIRLFFSRCVAGENFVYITTGLQMCFKLILYFSNFSEKIFLLSFSKG